MELFVSDIKISVEYYLISCKHLIFYQLLLSLNFRSRINYSSSHSGSSRDNSAQNPSIQWSDKERVRQVEERRVIYVGRIEEGTTKAHLRERFGVFGRIVDISVHFRDHG